MMVLVMVLAGCVASPALAAEHQAAVSAVVLSVHDGDTFKVRAAIWPDLDITVSVRLAHVDTPELRGKCAGERKRALAARDLVRDMMPVGSAVTLSNIRRDKYAGRVDASVTLEDGRDLAVLLLAKRLARAYDGGTKPDWCH